MKIPLLERFQQTRINISLKLSSIIALGVIVTYALFSVILYYDIKRNLEEDVDIIVKSQLENLNNTLEDLVHSQIQNNIEPEFNIDLIRPKLQERYQNKKIFNEGYLYVMDSKGQVIIHPKKEGNNFSNTSFGNRIISSTEKSGKFEYFWTESNKSEKFFQYYDYFEPYDLYIAATCKESDVLSRLFYYRNLMIFGTIIVIIFIIAIIYRTNSNFAVSLKKVAEVLANLALGKLDKEFNYKGNDELKDIDIALHKLIAGLKKTTKFSDDISNNELETDFKPLSNEDVLGLSLLDMREKIKVNRENEKKRNIEEEQQKWINQGLAKFSDILRANFENINEHGDNIIQNIVRYIDANQGGIFIFNNENKSDLHLELIAAFAYDTKKYLEKKIPYGEGLVGTCAIEKETIFLTEVPEGYFSITSGLGNGQPNSILIVPIKKDDEVLGVVELASFKTFKPYEIEFVEKIMESVAATLASLKINSRTKELLAKFEIQSKEMAEKEADMRQNIEELQAVQEEGFKKEQNYENLVAIYKRELLSAELDSEGYYIEASNELLSIMKTERKDLIGSNLFDSYPQGSEEYSVMYQNWKNLLSGTSFSETRTYKLGTERITFVEKYYPLLYSSGGVSKVIKIVNDITEHENIQNTIAHKNREIADLKEEIKRLQS